MLLTNSIPVALLVFCKRPKPYQGKQRIAQTLGAEKAYQIANALLRCALEDAEAWPGPVIISPASSEDVEWARELFPGRSYDVIAQPEGNMGERLNYLDRILRSEGHKRIVTIGTDAPGLGGESYREVCDLLADNSVVLSAADDGGVILMASSEPWPDIASLPWSTEHLGQALKDVCITQGLTVGHTASGYDVDLESDLIKVIRDLQNDRRPARRQLCNLLHELLSDGLAVNNAKN